MLHRVIHLTIHPTVFSDGFSEGQLRDINRGFPSDSLPYTDDYDYLSDSDLEDESSHSGKEEEELQDVSGGGMRQGLDGGGDSQSPQTITSNNPSSCPSSVETTEVRNGDRSFGVSIVFFPLWLTRITALEMTA
jgi:hypothetical protein